PAEKLRLSDDRDRRRAAVRVVASDRFDVRVLDNRARGWRSRFDLGDETDSWRLSSTQRVEESVGPFRSRRPRGGQIADALARTGDDRFEKVCHADSRRP